MRFDDHDPKRLESEAHAVPSPHHAGSRAAKVALTTAAMGLSGTVPTFLVLRFVGGAASALVLIIASTVVLERLASVGRSGLSALHFAGVGSGIGVSAVLVAAMLSLGYDWRSLWLASGAVSLGALLAVAVLLPNRAAITDALPVRGGGVALDAGLYRLIVAYGLFGFGYIITATFLVTIVRVTPVIRALEPVIWIVFGLAAAPSAGRWIRDWQYASARLMSVPPPSWVPNSSSTGSSRWSVRSATAVSKTTSRVSMARIEARA